MEESERQPFYSAVNPAVCQVPVPLTSRSPALVDVSTRPCLDVQAQSWRYPQPAPPVVQVPVVFQPMIRSAFCPRYLQVQQASIPPQGWQMLRQPTPFSIPGYRHLPASPVPAHLSPTWYAVPEAQARPGQDLNQSKLPPATIGEFGSSSTEGNNPPSNDNARTRSPVAQPVPTSACAVNWQPRPIMVYGPNPHQAGALVSPEHFQQICTGVPVVSPPAPNVYIPVLPRTTTQLPQTTGACAVLPYTTCCEVGQTRAAGSNDMISEFPRQPVISSVNGGDNLQTRSTHQVQALSPMSLATENNTHARQPHQDDSPKQKSHPVERQRRKVCQRSPEATLILHDWIDKNKQHPYPSREEKDKLIAATGMTPRQLQDYFGNKRRSMKRNILRAQLAKTAEETGATDEPASD